MHADGALRSTHNASARFRPPYWVKGEDSSFGFFIHISPFQTVTPIHWGWEVVHDGWEFRSQVTRRRRFHCHSSTSIAATTTTTTSSSSSA